MLEYKEKFTRQIVASIIAIGVLGLFFLGNFLYKPKTPIMVLDDTQIVAKVGIIQLSKKDIQRKIAVEKVYGAMTTEETALTMLVREATEQEVARNNNILPQESDIQAFNNHVNKNSKAKELLGEIKNIFETDVASYNRLYLLPKITNTKLHAFFASSTVFSKVDDRIIKEAYKELQSGMSFKDVAQKFDLQYEKTTFPPKIYDVPQGMITPENIPDGLFVVPDFIKNTKVGSISSEVIEQQDAYLLIKVLSKKGNTYELEMIQSPKPNYDDWYKNEVKKVAINLFALKTTSI